MKLNWNTCSSYDDDNDDGLHERTTEVSVLHYFAGK